MLFTNDDFKTNRGDGEMKYTIAIGLLLALIYGVILVAAGDEQSFGQGLNIIEELFSLFK